MDKEKYTMEIIEKLIDELPCFKNKGEQLKKILIDNKDEVIKKKKGEIKEIVLDTITYDNKTYYVDDFGLLYDINANLIGIFKYKQIYFFDEKDEKIEITDYKGDVIERFTI